MWARRNLKKKKKNESFGGTPPTSREFHRRANPKRNGFKNAAAEKRVKGPQRQNRKKEKGKII